MTGGDGPGLEQELSRLFQRVNVRMKLECWSQFEVHGADQVVLSQKQQSLPVDLLGAELLGHILPPCTQSKTPSRVHLMYR